MDKRSIGVEFEPAVVMVQALKEGGELFDLGQINLHFEKWYSYQC